VLIGTTFRELGERERFAIETWLTCPGVDIQLLGHSTRKARRQIDSPHYRIRYASVLTTESGVPRFDSMVNTVSKWAMILGHDLACIMNADIYLDPQQFTHVEEYLLSRDDWFLAVGQRIEWDGSHLPPCGTDYYIFRASYGRDLKIPPFAFGRCTYDNWMMYNALKTGVPLIDLTGVFDVYHQKHPESASSRLGQDAQENLRLCRQSYPDWTPWKGWVNQATERPTKEEVYGLSRVCGSHSLP